MPLFQIHRIERNFYKDRSAPLPDGTFPEKLDIRFRPCGNPVTADSPESALIVAKVFYPLHPHSLAVEEVNPQENPQ